MSVYKSLTTSDVIVTPFKANKSFSFQGASAITASNVGIDRFIGTNKTSSFQSGSTGEVIFDTFINNPQVYVTTVGMYNDANECIAVAKLSRPLLKDFTKESLIRVKLDF